MSHIFKRANRPCRSEDILFIIAVYVVHLDRKRGYDFPCIVKSKLEKKKLELIFVKYFGFADHSPAKRIKLIIIPAKVDSSWLILVQFTYSCILSLARS